MQRIQLKEARDEAKRIGAHEQTQAFETTFFNMLNLHAENARHLSFDPVIVRNAEPTKLTLWRKVVYLAVGSPEVPGPVYGRAVFAEVLRSTSRGATQNEPQLEAYRMLQVEHNDVLGHYFRHLYQILNHIDHFKIAGLQVDFNTRKRYSNILRAQLSSHELAVLLLNCSHQMVDDGSFKEKVIRYELLEHLPLYETGEGELRTNGIDPDSKSIFFEYFSIQKSQPTCWAPGAFGKNPTAIDYLSEQDSPAWKDKDHLNFPPQAQP